MLDAVEERPNVLALDLSEINEDSDFDTELNVSENSAAIGNALPIVKQRRPSKKGIASTKKPKKNVGAGKRSEKSTSQVIRPTRRMYMMFYARLAALLLVSIILIVVAIPLFPILAFHRKKWRFLVDNMQALWLNAFLWMIPETILEIHGELPDSSLKPKIIIANHATEVDWLYLWMIARMTNMGEDDRSGNVKIMLKEAVKHIPIVGWGCAMFDFIFLARKWEVDCKRIEDRLVQFTKDDSPLWIFLFVEGSTVNTRSVERSQSWARQEGRPVLENTLLPRVRGLEHVLNILTKHSKHEPEIFDMTMAFDSYSGEVPTWEDGYGRKKDHLIPNFGKMMFGTSSKRCYIDSRRYCHREVRDDRPESLQNWLDDRWVRKERLMKHFAENGSFCFEECGLPVSLPITGSIWRSTMAIAFYVSMWCGMVFTYVKYSTEGDGFFSKLSNDAQSGFF